MDQQKAWKFSSFNEESKNAPQQQHQINQQPFSLRNASMAHGYQQIRTGNHQDNLSAMLSVRTEYMGKKEIASQLAPEDFSYEDVQQLKKLNRELHAENMAKTLSYIKLEQNYRNLQDEVAASKSNDTKRREELNELLKVALSEIAVHQTDSAALQASEDLNAVEAALNVKSDATIELNNLKGKCHELKCCNLQLRRQVEIYEEKYAYFNSVVNESSVSLAEYKTKLSNATQLIKELKSEIALWRRRCLEYEADLQNTHYSTNRLQNDFPDEEALSHQFSTTLYETDTLQSNTNATAMVSNGFSGTSVPRQRQINKKFVENAVANYISPKSSISADRGVFKK